MTLGLFQKVVIADGGLAATADTCAGLVVVDVTPDLFFTAWDGIPLFAGVRELWKSESPLQRFGHQVGLLLSRHLAFLDSDYTLVKLIDQADLANREGVRGPFLDVWKIGETAADRQLFLWSRIESDRRLREHARPVWGPFDGQLVEEEMIAKACEEARTNVGKIRARGGEVVFIRAPSAGLYYESEQRAAPRAKTWDRLLRETGAYGVHFEDHADTRNLDVPEWSHLSRDSATRFTRAYVGLLAKDVEWLRSRPLVEAGS